MDKRIKNIIIKVIVSIVLLLITVQLVMYTFENIQEEISWNNDTNYVRMVENDISEGDYAGMYENLTLYDCYDPMYDKYWQVAYVYNDKCSWLMYKYMAENEENPEKKLEYEKKTDEMKQKVLEGVDKYSDNEYAAVLSMFANEVK